MANYVYGIDLGTTYSCIACVDDTGRPVVIDNMEGDNTTPSVVAFEDGNVVVGDVAKENAVVAPNTTVQLVKTLMGKTDFAINYNGEDKTPEEISSYILRKLAGDASQALNSEVKDVVITCPAYFGTPERIATQKAGEIAGLNVLAIINEPTAAALYYGVTKNKDSKTILVFDLGGGTFDVTVMQVSPDKIEVICSEGNHDLGGKLWDEAIMMYIADEYTRQTGDPAENIDEYSMQDMRNRSEKAKKQLTQKDSVPIMVDINGTKVKVKLTRETFDSLTETYLKQAIEKTDLAISEAKDKGYSIDEILLVGGSTRMPQVAKAIVENYHMEPKILDPDEAVAKGAAIYATSVFIEHQKAIEEAFATGQVQTNQQGEQVVITDAGEEIKVTEDSRKKLDVDETMFTIGGSAPKIVNATTKSYSTKVRNAKTGEYFLDNLIIKNEPMPDGVVSHSQTYGTSCDGQEDVLIDVYESDVMDQQFAVDESLKLGDALLKLPSYLPEGSPIKVSFTLTREGVLHVVGEDMTNHAIIEADLQATGIMSDETASKLAEKLKDIQVQ